MSTIVRNTKVNSAVLIFATARLTVFSLISLAAIDQSLQSWDGFTYVSIPGICET